MQLAGVYYHLRGASLTGSLAGPGIILGILIFMAGVWLAVDQPWWILLIWFIPSLLIAAVLLLAAGIIWNLGWDPSLNSRQANSNSAWNTQDVKIPVQLVHVAASASTALHMIPATYMIPKAWETTENNSRSAVLLVCGAGDARLAFKWRLVNELTRRGIGVLTIDPPGHGEFQNAPMSVPNARVANQAALDWLCAQPAISKVGACGISFGGNQVAALAAADERVAAIALISTPVSLVAPTRRVYIGEVAGLLWPRNIGLLRDGSVVTLIHEYRKLKGFWSAESLPAMIQAFGTATTIRSLGDRPKLILHGTRDVAVPVENARKLFAAALPERELLLVPQATHISPVLYPQEMAYMADWFAKWLNYNHGDAQHAV
jgi:alpha-beta hydrolase superfamily lysophospholipase